MADPVTWFAVASAASGAVTGLSARAAGQTQSASYDAAGQAADYNATESRQQADLAWEQAGAAEDQQRRKGADITGKARAAAAESGIDSSSGSSALVQEQGIDRANLDALMIRYGGNLKARGLNAQADQYAYEGEVDRANAGAARRGGNLGLAAGLLQGVSGFGQGMMKIKGTG